MDPPESADTSTSTSTPSPAPLCWSAVLQKKPPPAAPVPIASKVFGSCNSSKGVAVAVIDANALIHGDKIAGYADKFVSIKEVIEEVRDPVSRQRLSFLPFPVETMEPSAEFVKKVVKFARETGDLQTLSDVDIKLIALTYMLEAQIHGTSHLRDVPPPLRVVNVKTLGEKEMPGWGSNVPNLEEWEALEHLSEGGNNSGSRILQLKDLNNQVISEAGSECHPDVPEGGDQPSHRPERIPAPKIEINLLGKKMVADGIDASLGEDTENIDDWQPAVSRSTHRRYLRRKARKELLKTSEENDQTSVSEDVETITSGRDGARSEGEPEHTDSVDCKISQDFVLEEDLSANNIDESISLVEGDDVEECTSELDNLEITSQSEASVDTSYIGDGESEQSWTLRSLSESSVACVTSDYAMQNVILQIGLRLLAPGGMQIRQLHRWVLKCHACNKMTQEIGKIFCPKCGNGGTLKKVSVTVGENGIVMAARKQRVIVRGTKFSLPMPQGGREAITKNLILREDQLPRKLLYPKSKKKANEQDEFLSSDDIFSHSGDKRAPLQPPVKKALALFGGRKNPNDNHFSRRNH